METVNEFIARVQRAEAMVGELMRDGKTIHYIYPVNGEYKEGSFGELVMYVVQNHLS